MVADSSKTVFRQERNGTKLVFEFGDQTLSFRHSDPTGENAFEVPYQAIDLQHPASLLVKGFSMRYPEIVLVAAGLSMIYVAVAPVDRFLGFIFGSAWSGIGIGFRLFSSIGTKFTVLNIQGGTIRIIQNTQHEAILAELRKRWAGSLRKLLGAVNKANDPAKELVKFQWLKQTGAISQEEFESAQAEISPHLPAALSVATTIQ